MSGSEAELRRRAMESMLKSRMAGSGSSPADAGRKGGGKKGDGDGKGESKARDDGDFEDGEVDDGMQVDSPAVQAPRDGGKIHGSQNGSGAGTPSDGTPAAGAKPKKSKWAEDDSEEEGGGAAAPQPAQAPPGKAKSKWAEDSPSPEAPGAAAPEPGAKMADDVLSKAAGQVDATSALDMLEDRLLRKRGAAAMSGAEAGAEDGEAGASAAAPDDAPAQGAEGPPAEEEAAVEAPVGLQRKKLNRCREVDRAYQKLNKIDEGTYGVVYRARCRTTERVVALKQVKLERAREGFPLTALRELTVLLGLKHVNIVEVIEVVVSPKKQVFMVMEFMEHDFRALMESMKTPFRTGQVKCLMKQLLAGVEFMHRHWVIHRDLKTSNLLLDNQGNLKVCDFGLARNYSDPIKLMTPEVVTLWYRAPELLYGSKEYSIAIDMWSVGCIFAEFLLKEPIMKGKTEQDQRDKISELLGTPDEDRWPAFKDLPYAKGVRFKKKPCVLREKLPKVSYTGGPSLSDCGYELLQKMLCFNPAQRIAAHEALRDDYFPEPPLACRPEDMPTWPSLHEAPRGAKKRASSADVEDNREKAFFDEDSRFNRAL